MIITDEMNKVLDLVQNTDDHVFVTGKAGAGKTTFLKHLINSMKKSHVVAAPTGVAAINAGGVTLHSLFGIPFGPITPETTLQNRFSPAKIELLLNLDVLIIDEISMVRADVMDCIDRKLRWVREDQTPFGGVQLVMFGDLYQLPPVIKSEDKKILCDYYDDFYFFNAIAFQHTGFHVVELSKIFRQTDPTFVKVLNSIRNYEVTAEDLDILSELKDKKISSSYDGQYIHVCTHRAKAEKINTEMLGEHSFVCDTIIMDEFPESSVPCNMSLKLRVGARVMTMINNPTEGFYNGSLGTVLDIKKQAITVKLDNGITAKVEKHTWKNNRFTVQDGQIVTEEIGSCTQFPLQLAWAITIHKSQGLTFDKIVLHVAKTFCPGQLYVALSRCRTLEGIISDSFIKKQMIIPEYALIDFERAYTNDNNYYGRRV